MDLYFKISQGLYNMWPYGLPGKFYQTYKTLQLCFSSSSKTWKSREHFQILFMRTDTKAGWKPDKGRKLNWRLLALMNTDATLLNRSKPHSAGSYSLVNPGQEEFISVAQGCFSIQSQ